MHITSIDYMRVFVPWRESFQQAMCDWRARSHTTTEEEDAFVVIRVHTDEGIVGLGEGGRSIAEIKAIGDRLVGQNPMALDILDLKPPFVHAMVDIVGQALDVPAHVVLGGKHRERVPVAWWSPYLRPEETARQAEEGARLGFKVHKLKARPWDAVHQVKAVASAVGSDMQVRLDPNETYRLPAVTTRIDAELAAYNVECFEDPVPKARPEWYALLRSKCAAPLAIHTHDTKLIMDMARVGGMDYVNVGGTPHETRAAAAVAEAAGCPVWVQFEGHCLDVAAAFAVHVGAAIPNATLPADILHFLRGDHITQEPLAPQGGEVAVPEGPGLGIALDDDKIAKYRLE